MISSAQVNRRYIFAWWSRLAARILQCYSEVNLKQRCQTNGKMVFSGVLTTALPVSGVHLYIRHGGSSIVAQCNC